MSKQSTREGSQHAQGDARKAGQGRRRVRRAAIGAGALAAVAAAGAGIALATSGGGTPAATAPQPASGASGTASPAASAPPATPPATAPAASGGSATGPYLPLASLGTLAPAPAPGPLGPENVPVPAAPPLASTATAATGQPVDGISCAVGEQTVLHIHTHLTIFVGGQARQVPAGIGIPHSPPQQSMTASAGSDVCFYWLHTHDEDGIIHIESPVRRAFTLGEFFDEWGQPLGPDQVGPARGKVTVIINGRVFTGSPRQAPLGARENLTLEVGTPLVAPPQIDWSKTRV